MKTHPKQQEFLTEVMTEGVAADFQSSLLAHTLREVSGRKRRRRTIHLGGATLAIVLGVAGLFWRAGLTASATVQPTQSVTYQLIQSQPLPAAAVITTQRMPAGSLVAQVPRVETIATRRSLGIRLIDDNELLALLPGPAGLRRTGPDTQELILLDRSQPTMPAN